MISIPKGSKSISSLALKTDDLQFAYKANTSTLQFVSMVQETISYYINNGGHVVMCMMNASQVFGCVNLLTLFKKAAL